MPELDLATATAAGGRHLLAAAETGWLRPVPHCPGWNAADLVGHIGAILGWHLQVDQPLHYPAALGRSLVADRWLSGVVQALPVDLGREPVAGAGRYQHPVVPVFPDLVQGPREIGVHLPG